MSLSQSQIEQVLEAHVGTATTFCRACPDWIPPRSEIDDPDERLAIRRHQAEILVALDAHDRAVERNRAVSAVTTDDAIAAHDEYWGVDSGKQCDDPRFQ